MVGKICNFRSQGERRAHRNGQEGQETKFQSELLEPLCSAVQDYFHISFGHNSNVSIVMSIVISILMSIVMSIVMTIVMSIDKRVESLEWENGSLEARSFEKFEALYFLRILSA